MDLIINIEPIGMIPTKNMTPHVPVTVTEIIEDVYQACRIGITKVHLHARDEKTASPSYTPEVYGRIIEGIRAFDRELDVCASLSRRVTNEFEHSAAPLQLEGEIKPDMGSLKMSSVAIASGEVVHVGLEDNIWYDSSRRILATNLDLIKRAHVMADANERQIMKPADLRKLLNLKESNVKFGRLYERQ